MQSSILNFAFISAGQHPSIITVAGCVAGSTSVKRKYIKNSHLALFGFLIMLCGGCNLFGKKSVDPAIVKLPSFNVQLIDSSVAFNTNNIPEGKMTMFVFYDPDCGSCQHEAKSITDSISKLGDTQIYFLSSAPVKKQKSFAAYFKMERYENIKLGTDTENSARKLFKADGTPYTVLYDREKHLIKIYSGEVSIKKLIKVIGNG